MTPREAYNRYKGKKIKSRFDVGIIVGYYDDNIDDDILLIIAITEKTMGNHAFINGWHKIDFDDHIIDIIDNPMGYDYVDMSEINYFKYGH